MDAPGGGGKRDVHSFEHYERDTGVSVYTAPSVKPGRYFCYFDPIELLPKEGTGSLGRPAGARRDRPRGAGGGGRSGRVGAHCRRSARREQPAYGAAFSSPSEGFLAPEGGVGV